MDTRLTLAVIVPHGNHLIYSLHGREAFALALPDFVRVATALDDWFTHGQLLSSTDTNYAGGKAVCN